jgi:hypothetical protein
MWDVAIKSLQDYTANTTNSVISLDYLYLGLANIKKLLWVTDVTAAEPVLFNKGIELQRKRFAMESAVVNDLSEAGKGLYEQKKYKEAAAVFLKYQLQIKNLKISYLTIST